MQMFKNSTKNVKELFKLSLDDKDAYLIKKVIITPKRIIFQPEVVVASSRFLRKYGKINN